MAAEPANPASDKTPVRVACVGDSITQGSGAAKGKSYPAQLQELLGESWVVGNFGISGSTLLKKGDFPYWKEKAYQKALGFKPNVVIIMLGTNDTKPQNWQHEAEFVANYTELVKSFQALESKPKIYVCRPCPVPEPGNFGINEAGVHEEIKRLDALAAEMKLGRHRHARRPRRQAAVAAGPRPSERRGSRGNGQGRVCRAHGETGRQSRVTARQKEKAAGPPRRLF